MLLRSLSPIYKMGILAPNLEGTGQENSKCETSAWPGPMAGYRVAAARLLLAVSDSLASQPPTWAQTPPGSPGDSGGTDQITPGAAILFWVLCAQAQAGGGDSP